MTKTSKTTQNSGEPIVFFGSGPVAAASLDFLSDHFPIEMVITKAAPAHHKEAAPVEVLVKHKGLPVLFANTKAELDELMARQQFNSRLGVIVDFGVIVSQQTIDSFPLGIVNSHFSLLPEWRGADPITFSILSGQSKTGVSLMLIEPSLDTGKILTQKSLPVNSDETTPSLTKRLVNFSNELLLEYLPQYLDGTITPHSQSHPDRATYSRKLTKEDGHIDWSKPAAQIEREIRAFIGWPGSFTELAGKKVTVTKAHVVDDSGQPGTPAIKDKTLLVYCGEQALAIDMIKPEGKKEMAGWSFVAGHKHLL